MYHVASADVKALERDERIFAVAVLAGRRMLEADGDPEKRGLYSLELLNLMRERGYDVRRTRSLQRFVYRILRIVDQEIDPKVREVWNMQLIPIDEAIREIHIRDAKEEGIEQGIKQGIEKGIEKGIEQGEEKKAFEVARKMRARKMSDIDIIDLTGLNEKDMLSI